MPERVRAVVRGAVQGVGFRPFVFRLATELGLGGWVRNSPQGVFLEVEGDRPALEAFLLRFPREHPPHAVIQSLETSWLDPAGYVAFEIRQSEAGGDTTALVLPDIATCAECLREVRDPGNRRYRYPFTNCTNCGPRFTIIEALPYDRPGTSMRAFRMCPACRREYNDPCDRRFHAQPNACPACGPQLTLWDESGHAQAHQDDALREAARALRRGEIVAVKGLGGFHLMAAATDNDAVERLRLRKHREEKPFALMFPDLAAVERVCHVSAAESRLLVCPESPIVLLARRPEVAAVAPSVAPRNPFLGIMLPCTPLHHLFLQDVGGPVVATSGNLSDEPICINEQEAIDRLGGLADRFLVHDRPIVRHADDSIVRVVLGRELVLRRARGYAPLPIPLRSPAPPLLAVGAHLKNTVAVTAGPNVFVSQHIGDLETRESMVAFRRVIDSFRTLYRVVPARVAADLHPDYASTKYARRLGLRVVSVQHHYAHVAACMAENELEGRVLGVSWDGTGYGTDGTVWGGEFLLAQDGGWSRVACLRPFRLPGGDRAIREPRRSALGLLHALQGPAVETMLHLAPVAAFESREIGPVIHALGRALNAPVATSAGRLFDGVAALLNLRQRSSFEGQAAMELEFVADPTVVDGYAFAIVDGAPQVDFSPWQPPRAVVDWGPLVEAVLADVAAGVPLGAMSARFHNALADAIVAVAARVGEPRVALTGGCFQNRLLTERVVVRLRGAGFRPYWHQRVPPNDGGIALGQVAAVLRADAWANANRPGRPGP